eukprot:TRINITY_DN1826_c0_g1_i1.p1 TRINITY_DN1826_c0_g1~~TRINITY_DN1826_c0_g1_i1.p1  ORF type:complete len:314 (-),score=71.35 TRINITY_DN1826_c0_g1_i1:133-969(-)
METTGRYANSEPILKYWLVLALWTVLEYYCDIFLFWIPFFYELKLVVFLWLALSKGGEITYDAYLENYLEKNEDFIDSCVTELKNQTRVGALRIFRYLFVRFQDMFMQALMEGQKLLFQRQPSAVQSPASPPPKKAITSPPRPIAIFDEPTPKISDPVIPTEQADLNNNNQTASEEKPASLYPSIPVVPNPVVEEVLMEDSGRIDEETSKQKEIKEGDVVRRKTIKPSTSDPKVGTTTKVVKPASSKTSSTTSSTLPRKTTSSTSSTSTTKKTTTLPK